MKQSLLALVLSFGCFFAQAQKDVYLRIDHFLGNSPFSYNTQSLNNIGNIFTISRMEYYISQIQLVHDGGMITPVVNKWILVDADLAVNEMLGNYNITNLEAIKFTVGVEKAVNHLDPASYPMTHPLAPKQPSMHWGWTSGYRFAALEGKSGSNLLQTFAFHALGDTNYYPLTLNTAGIHSGNMITVQMDADYNKTIYNIDVSAGSIVHGEGGDAKSMLINFNRNVFVSSEGNNTIGIQELSKVKFQVYPNPSKGELTLNLIDANTQDLSVMVSDILGNQILNIADLNSDQTKINLDTAGIYFVTVINKSSGAVHTEKIVISH